MSVTWRATPISAASFFERLGALRRWIWPIGPIAVSVAPATSLEEIEMVPLVLTFVGDDRPGLVNAMSEKIAACGATWLESRSARLAGKFAGILLVGVPEANVAALEKALGDLKPAGLVF